MLIFHIGDDEIDVPHDPPSEIHETVKEIEVKKSFDHCCQLRNRQNAGMGILARNLMNYGSD